MSNKKVNLIVIGILIAAPLTATPAVWSATLTPVDIIDNEIESISLSFSFEIPAIKTMSLSGTSFSKVELQGCEMFGHAGEPRLPVKPLRILLPQSTKVHMITVETAPEISLGNIGDIELGEKAYRLDQDPPNQPPVPIYETNQLYPGNLRPRKSLGHTEICSSNSIVWSRRSMPRIQTDSSA